MSRSADLAVTGFIVVLTASGACARAQVSTTTPTPGAVLLVMPRTFCTDTDSIGTVFEALIDRYDPWNRPDPTLPEGSTARVAMVGFSTQGHPEIKFRIDSITARGRRYAVAGNAITEVERTATGTIAGHAPGAVCYMKGATLPGNIEG